MRLWPVEMGVEDWSSQKAREEGSGQSWVHGGKRLKERERIVRQSLGRRPGWGRRGEGKARPSRTEVPWTSEHRSMRSARGRMSPATQGLAPSRHSAHRCGVRDCVNQRMDFHIVTAFQPCHTGFSRQGSARFQDLNSTLLTCRGLNRRSPWSVTPGSSQGQPGRPLICQGTVMCGVCGAEGRWRPPRVRVSFPQTQPSHSTCPGGLRCGELS